MKINWTTLFHRAFQVGVLLKGLDGVVEFAGGSALLLTTSAAILQAVTWLTRQELIEDPHDFIANHLLHAAQHLSVGTEHFAGLYLIGHGLVKIALVGGLLRGWTWSYPAAVVVLTGFIGYQSYQFMQRPSLLLAALTVIDVAVVLLTALEWWQRRHLSHRR